MTAPLRQRIRCALFGHDWRTAIGPRDGFYRRCRRCWVNRPLEDAEEAEEPMDVASESRPAAAPATARTGH